MRNLALISTIGVARILSAGVHFFTKKVLLWLGVHFVSCGGALTHFSCKLGLEKIFFTALGGVQVHPLHPLATPMISTILKFEPPAFENAAIYPNAEN